MKKFTDKINESFEDKKIFSAEQFIEEYLDVDGDFIEKMREQMSNMSGFNFDNIPDLMAEYAKYHVKAALKSAAENVETYDYPYMDCCPECGRTTTYVKEDSILNAYPLENIK